MPLSYQVMDAKYSRGLDRVVMVTYTDFALHLFDPHANVDAAIPLPAGLPRYTTAYVGLYVGLSPDGLKALVTDTTWVVYVDLVAATVIGQWQAPPLSVGIQNYFVGVAVGADGYGYMGTGSSIASMSVSTGAFASTMLRNAEETSEPTFAISSDGTTLYTMSGYENSALYGAPALGSNVGEIAQSTAGACGPPWVSRDGTRIFTGCGPTFGPAVAFADGGVLPVGPALQVPPAQVEPEDAGDVPYLNPPIFWVDDPSNGNPIAAVGMDPGSPNQHTGAFTLALYDPSSLALLSTAPVPVIASGGVSYPSIPAFVFYDASGTTRYEVLFADVGAQNVWAVASF
jgi:hypothetical protein